jgi:hypothetical protein
LLAELKSSHAKLVEVINEGEKPADDQNQQVIKVAEAIAKTYQAAEKPQPKQKEAPDG